jgi:HEAT repeat protein
MLGIHQNNAANFEQAISELRDPQAAFSAETIYSLTDLAGDRLDTFLDTWEQLPVERQRSLISRLVETTETNFELDFSAIIFPALRDADEQVRRTALEGVLEDSPPRIIERLMAMAQEDPFSTVRATAAKMLGQFVLKGELGKLPDDLNARLQDTVLALYRNLDEGLDVRRRALEAIANCGRTGVPEMIREAYYADELPMRVSALFAMGRSCDRAWSPQVMAELNSEYPELRFEAARAAGELELRQALPRLVELAYEEDREIQEMAIWAMGEIGGEDARDVLTDLAALADELADRELGIVIQQAQNAANLAGEELIPLFDFSEHDETMIDTENLTELDDDLYDLDTGDL